MTHRSSTFVSAAAVVLVALVPAACGRASPPPRPVPEPAADRAAPPAGEEARQQWLDATYGEDRTISDGIAPPRRTRGGRDGKPAPAPAPEPQDGGR